MKAVAFNELGGPEKLRIQDVPDPEIGPGQILLRVRACALNHLDIFVRQGIPGLKIPLPFWTGSDVAGDVVELGRGITSPPKGTRVIVNPSLGCGACEFCRGGEDTLCARYEVLGEHRPGGLAEFIAVDATNVLPLPSHVDHVSAAASILTNMTAWRMLITQGMLRPGQNVLVLGVGGGVSSSAVQIAKLAGARVIVTSSSAAKLDRARSLGADIGINYSEEDWVSKVYSVTAGRGVDLVIENVGAATWKSSLRCLRKGGRLVTCGATSGPFVEIDVRALFWKQIQIIGSTMANRKEFDQVMSLVFEGRLQPIIDEVFPFSRAIEAHQKLERGLQFGKIVVQM